MADNAACPLGKLVVKTRTAWVTKSGRGRANANLRRLFSAIPPSTAPSILFHPLNVAVFKPSLLGLIEPVTRHTPLPGKLGPKRIPKRISSPLLLPVGGLEGVRYWCERQAC